MMNRILYLGRSLHLRLTTYLRDKDNGKDKGVIKLSGRVMGVRLGMGTLILDQEPVLDIGTREGISRPLIGLNPRRDSSFVLRVRDRTGRVYL